MLPCASLWALEADVTLRDVMSVEYFTNPSTASLFTVDGTCATPWRRSMHSDLSPAVLPPSLYERVRDLGFLAKVVMLTVLRATLMDLSEAATWWAARGWCLVLTTGAASAKEGTLCCSFGM